jgi:membrane-bound ClpP family serine protease
MTVPAQTVPATPENKNQGLAIASLVLGILSLCAASAWWCGGPISVIGIVLGVLGISMPGKGKGMAVVGLILSILGLFLLVLIRVIFRGLIFSELLNRYLNR